MKEWFVKWFTSFWDAHGERLIFAFLATVFALAFWKVFHWEEAAKTILIGIAMLLYNKTRTGEKDAPKS